MNTQNIRLLIVDDEEQIRKVLSYIIHNSEIADFEIREASSAEEATEILKKEEIDIIICDYLLDAMSGISFFSNMSTEHPYTVRILISGNVNYDELRNAVSRGDIFRFLSKPFNEDEIISVLKESLDRVKSNRQGKDLINRLRDF